MPFPKISPQRRRTIIIGLAIGTVTMAAFFAAAQWLTVREVRHNAIVQKHVWIVDLPKGKKAPDFALTDQRGRTVRLSQFRGKAVVLEFMDPHCTDICPLVSREFILAYHELGPAAQQAVFLAVNVNARYNRVTDVKAFADAQGLDKLPNFHFLTGPVPRLKTVWKSYSISVMPGTGGEVRHSAPIYFISPAGHERYIGHPQNNRPSVPYWSHAIAYYVRQTF